jgi:hypothetical protein
MSQAATPSSLAEHGAEDRLPTSRLRRSPNAQGLTSASVIEPRAADAVASWISLKRSSDGQGFPMYAEAYTITRFRRKSVARSTAIGK